MPIFTPGFAARSFGVKSSFSWRGYLGELDVTFGLDQRVERITLWRRTTLFDVLQYRWLGQQLPPVVWDKST
jgi:hypothetical protein